MSKMVLLAAILNLPFEIWTLGGYLVLTIWNTNFFVHISNGECKMAAKNNIIDIYVLFSNAISKPAYFPPFKIWTHPYFRSPP